MKQSSSLDIATFTEKSSENDAQHQTKILVVEDSKTEQLRLKTILSKIGYDVLLANNGLEAINIMEKEHCQLVISDWRMPELTGIELCRRLREDQRYKQLYFILLTGFDSKNDLIAGMDAGADDFIAKPVSSEELRVRVQAGIRIINLHNELEVKNEELEITLQREQQAYDLIQTDLAAAAIMQKSLLPDNSSPFRQLEIASLFEPASVIAGDGFGYFKLDADHLGFYHFDVAGHGIASAMLSFTLTRLLSPAFIEESLFQKSNHTHNIEHLTENIVAPSAVIASLNERFSEEQDCQHYFTMIYGVLNIRNGRGQLCQAGHPYPLIVTAEGQVNAIGEGGFPVGMLSEAEYEDIAFKLTPGDRLVLYSDGIPECKNISNEMFNNDNFHNILSQTHRAPLASALDILKLSLQRWQGNEALNDDISLLAFDFNSSFPHKK